MGEVFDSLAMGFSGAVWALQGVKEDLQLAPRLGWNGDPCVPVMHTWSGVTCSFDSAAGAWEVTAM